jgi:hypothetical protein
MQGDWAMNNTDFVIYRKRWTIVTAKTHAYTAYFGRYRLYISAWIMSRRIIKNGGHVVRIDRVRRGKI